jgi:hypothetical protein
MFSCSEGWWRRRPSQIERITAAATSAATNPVGIAAAATEASF